MKAGALGCTPIDQPRPRDGVGTSTSSKRNPRLEHTDHQRGSHGGPYQGRMAATSCAARFGRRKRGRVSSPDFDWSEDNGNVVLRAYGSSPCTKTPMAMS